ncbi:MAG: SUMF1/EgtB/PvdO family nonheme iron enzyme [Bacteroidales bacterium]|nr:SUMF1/EgtB/PvdO family nonheme iron enzyme [Bacteroidales bacterium]
MIVVPGGTFSMGSADSVADADENPVHQVNIKSFRLCRFEVNQKLWMAVMKNNPSANKGPSLPVESISIEDVDIFLERLNKLTGRNYRLPTEAEWEYAASFGPDSKESIFEQYSWYLANSGHRTHECGSKKPNCLGVYDLIGNVHEWCSDVYTGDDYSGNHVIDIQEKEVVFRGGALDCPTRYCRRTNRNHTVRSTKNYAVGIRLAESI